MFPENAFYTTILKKKIPYNWSVKWNHKLKKVENPCPIKLRSEKCSADFSASQNKNITTSYYYVAAYTPQARLSLIYPDVRSYERRRKGRGVDQAEVNFTNHDSALPTFVRTDYLVSINFTIELAFPTWHIYKSTLAVLWIISAGHGITFYCNLT